MHTTTNFSIVFVILAAIAINIIISAATSDN